MDEIKALGTYKGEKATWKEDNGDTITRKAERAAYLRRKYPLNSPQFSPPPTEAGSASFTVVNTDTQSTTIVREWFAPAFPGLAGLYICTCMHVFINIPTLFCTFGDTLLIASKTKLNLVLLPSPPTIKNNIVRYQWGIPSPPPSNVDGLRALKNTCRCPGSGFTGQILHPLGD